MFVAFNIKSTKFLIEFRKDSHRPVLCKTKGPCTRAINRAAKKGLISKADYSVLPLGEFLRIEKTETVKNLMTGADVVQSVNTPPLLRSKL